MAGQRSDKPIGLKNHAQSAKNGCDAVITRKFPMFGVKGC